MSRNRVALLAFLAAAGCYTNRRGEENLCIPGHDGLCPAPEIMRVVAPVKVITIGEPIVLARSTEVFAKSPYGHQLSTTLDELAVDSDDQRELPFSDQVRDGNISVACTTFCAAVWIDEAGTVHTAVRETNSWSTPVAHSGPTGVPTVAISGDVVLIAWLQSNGTRFKDVQLRHLDRAGKPRGSLTIPAHVGNGETTVTGGPAGFLITWERYDDSQLPGTSFLVAQAMNLDGTLVDSPFEVQLPNEQAYFYFEPSATAYIDGAYRVVNDHLPGMAMWAVIDPSARSIQFAGPSGYQRAIHSITPANPGALLTVSGGQANIPASVVRIENDMFTSIVNVPGTVQVAPSTEGYLLAYRSPSGALLLDRRDSNLQPIEAPRVIAEDENVDNGCNAGGGADLGTMLALLALLRGARSLRVFDRRHGRTS